MSLAEARTRRSHAHDFKRAAELVDEFGHDADVDHLGNTLGSLAVLAGIAASDAICGATLGEYAAGEAHHEAVKLLESSQAGRPLAPSLKRLLDAKSEAAYSPRLFTEGRARELLISATRLIDGMDDVFRALP